MRPERRTPGSPADWLRYARSDLALARGRRKRGVLQSTLCYHAHQAAEKSLKAVLLAASIPFPYTHDLARLITLVRGAGLRWPGSLDAALKLTEYAVSSRYPGISTEVTAKERLEAVKVARCVLGWARQELKALPRR
ncbi:MAG: HEPN domain-containing protein [Planctomycetota bacterium]|nr:HEPN domain-containing protein [Planctomycetota bacterium]